MQTTHQLNFDDTTKRAMAVLIEKYGIALDWDKDFWDFSKKDPEVVIFNLARRILKREGNFQDISKILQKDLKMDKEKADTLAHDIKNTVVVLAEAIEPEEPEENEEENIETKARTVIVQQPAKPKSDEVDPYKETIE